MPFRVGVTAALLLAPVWVLVVASGEAARAADHPVVVSDNAFTPAALTITQGDTVIWTNAPGGNNHNVAFTNGPAFVMPSPATSAWTVERVFDQVGTFGYVCQVHSFMTGTITVNAAPGPPPGGEDPPPGGPPPAPGDPPPGGPGPGPPGGPGPGAPGEPEPFKITLKVSDATPLAGSRLKLSGRVRPARDGRKVQIQRRSRGGSFRTIATTRLKDAGAAKSKFSVMLRLRGDAVLRARIAGDDDNATGLSRTRAIDVHRRGR
jgi:plastocyanin